MLSRRQLQAIVRFSTFEITFQSTSFDFFKPVVISTAGLTERVRFTIVLAEHFKEDQLHQYY